MTDDKPEKKTETYHDAISAISSGIKDLTSDIRLIIYERLSNPVIGSIFLSAIAFHIKEILLITFAGEKRYELVQNFKFNPLKLLEIIVVGAAYSFISPWLHAFYAKRTMNSKIESINVENDITSSNRLTLDQSKQILARIKELQPTVTKQHTEIDQLNSQIRKFEKEKRESDEKFEAAEFYYNEEIEKANEAYLSMESKRNELIAENQKNIDDLIEFLSKNKNLTVQTSVLKSKSYPRSENHPDTANSIRIEFQVDLGNFKQLNISIPWHQQKPTQSVLANL